MSESTDSPMPAPGTITWTEIPVQDVNRAQKFYTSLFGWEVNSPLVPCPETGKLIESKHVLFTKGACHGSFVKVTQENHLSPAVHPDNKEKKRQSVTVTITTESVDGVLKIVDGLGGEVYIPKFKVPGENMGYLAYILDTEKNVMGIWSMT